MNLLVAVEDYCSKKVEQIGAMLGIPLTKRQVSLQEIKALDPLASTFVLQTSAGCISQHYAIIRYLAQVTHWGQLYGFSNMENSLVDQWLEFLWHHLETQMQAHICIQSELVAEYAMSQQLKKAIVSKMESEIRDAIAILDNYISGNTYFAGERITVADLCIYIVLGLVIDDKLGNLEGHQSLKRWFLTIGHQPNIAVVRPLPSSFLAPAVPGPKVKQGKSTTEVKVPSASKQSSKPQPTAKPQASEPSSVPSSGVVLKSSQKWSRCRIRVKELLAKDKAAIGEQVTVKGWVRTIRDMGQTVFVELTDGSTVKGLQLVMDSTATGYTEVTKCGGAGASVSATGTVVESIAKGQSIEILVTNAEVLGPVYGGDDGEVGGKNYPMAKKKHSMEFLREKAHLRPRSKVFSSAMRMRHAMAFATHKFFNDRGFVYVHTPLITAADCEGAGEQFAVTSLLPEHANVSKIPVDKAGNVDFSKDFFGRRCCLTVSGQLNVETHACALSDVYTFGPTFRAENSHTARHLAEFWMIEPEICFAELADDMALAEDYVRYCAAYALEHCADDLAYLENEYPDGEKGLRARLLNVVESDFAHITYTDAIELLQRDAKAKKVKFEKFPNWGDDLGSEHERYMAEKVYCRPTIVTDYPKGIKAFYMKLNPDGKTVAAMDILVPKIGELIGGSQREDNLQILEQRCIESGLKPSDIWWYADLRRYGTVPHAGFGLGFERLIMFVTGLENIRDVIPFPRVPGHADF